MKTNFVPVILMLTSSLFSCKNDPQKVDAIWERPDGSVSSVGEGAKFFFHNSALIDSLAKRALDFGDTVAYERLYEIYYAAGLAREFYYYSFMMADQHNYGKASFQTSAIMGAKKRKGIHDTLSTYYLLKSYEQNYKRAKQGIEYEFGNSKIPSSAAYLKTLCSQNQRTDEE